MYSSRYYPKKRRYHSSYSRKRIYGSSYQPGYTTQYQQYGRTIPLNSAYPVIPTELPTRQSQILQVEELKKAGLIPEPEPQRTPLQIKLDNITFNEITYPTAYVHDYLNSIDAPDGKYLVNIFCTNGVPISVSLPSSNEGTEEMIGYLIIQHNASTYDNVIEGGKYLNSVQAATYTSNSALGCSTMNSNASPTNYTYLYPNSIKKMNGQAATTQVAKYTILIYEIIE